MILGVPQGDRIPFSRPDQATPVFQPPYPRTGFLTNLQPFATLPPMLARRARLPGGPGGMNPGGRQIVAQQTPPSAPGMNGAGFGHGHGDPYRVMRTGQLPGVYGDGRNIRHGINTAGQVVRAQTPYPYGQTNDPVGGMAPIQQTQPQAPSISGAWRGFGTAFGRSR